MKELINIWFDPLQQYLYTDRQFSLIPLWNFWCDEDWIFYWNDISPKTGTGNLGLNKRMKHIGNVNFAVTLYIEVKSELIQASKTEIFAKVIKGFKSSTICARNPA